MLETTKAIALSKIKYAEKDLIVKCFTENHGVVSFMVKNAFSKKSRSKLSYFQQLTLLEITFNYKNGKSLCFIKEIRDRSIGLYVCCI